MYVNTPTHCFNPVRLSHYSLEAMKHPRCVGWGEIGLDYHYDNSPREIQQEVFARQLRQAVKLGKPLTIHTREAEEDTERILKEEVPKDHKVSAALSTLALRLLTPQRRFIYIAILTHQSGQHGCLTTFRTYLLVSQVCVSPCISWTLSHCLRRSHHLCIEP